MLLIPTLLLVLTASSLSVLATVPLSSLLLVSLLLAFLILPLLRSTLVLSALLHPLLTTPFATTLFGPLVLSTLASVLLMDELVLLALLVPGRPCSTLMLGLLVATHLRKRVPGVVFVPRRRLWLVELAASRPLRGFTERLLGADVRPGPFVACLTAEL